MIVYIVIERSAENTIRFATLRKDIAEQIKDAFGYMGLTIIEMNLIGTCEPC